MKGLLKFGILICLLFLTLLSGCTVLSLFPFYQDKELIDDERLIGLWNNMAIVDGYNFDGPTEPESEDNRDETVNVDPSSQNLESDAEIWTISKADETGVYRIHVASKTKQSELIGYLFRLNNLLLLDMYPDKETLGNLVNNTLGMHITPVHSLSKVEVEKDTIQLKLLSADWFSQLIKKRKTNCKYTEPEDGVFLFTDKTEDFRKFLDKNISQEAFGKGITFQLIRVQEPLTNTK